MENVNSLFTELVRSQLCNETPQLHKEELTPDVLIDLYQLSAKHHLTHMVALALKKAGLLGSDAVSRSYHQKLMSTMLRHESFDYMLQRIRSIFEEAEIPFIPLKGSVLCKYYPEDWMRTKSDLDILVREQDLKRANNLLKEKLGYKVQKQNYHDIAMVSPENILLELHFRLLEHEGNIDRALERVWDYAEPIAPGRYEYAMTEEFLMFHVYAHMYYHFLQGGCGLRFLVDIYLMNQQMTFNQDKLETLYKVCKLETFVHYVEKLIAVCFGDEEHDQITAMMEEYIITGGIFGSFESKIKARKTKSKGRNRYLMKRFFMPLHEMQASYPKLEKYPVLYPVYSVKRWMKILNKETAGTALKEMQINKKMKQDGIDELKALFAILKGDKHV